MTASIDSRTAPSVEIDRCAEPCVRLPRQPQSRDEQNTLSHALPAQLTSEKLGDLRKREYKYEIEEQFKRLYRSVTGVRFVQFGYRIFGEVANVRTGWQRSIYSEFYDVCECDLRGFTSYESSSPCA